MGDLTVVTHSPEQTRRLGEIIGGLASGGDIFLLSGNLGTGKTHLVQGLAFGLGVKEYACSPSFMIVREYHGRLPLYHMDLYRLDHIEEIIDLGLEEYFRNGSVCAIEWAEKGSGALPHDYMAVEMQHRQSDDRRVTFKPEGTRYASMIKDLKAAIEKETESKWNWQ
jgi:tRNA threonylcarbamoyladenosine biosynthesis protein TsaE